MSEAFKKYINKESIAIFGEAEFNEADLYFVFYPKKPISKENRKKLKEMGWELRRNPNEVWIMEKSEEAKAYYAATKNS